MLKDRQELAEYREKAKAAYAAQTERVIICAGTGCVAGGSLKVYEKLLELMKAEGLPVEVVLEEEPHAGAVGLKKSGCHGFCEMGPLLRIDPQGWLYTRVQVEDCAEFVE